MQKEKLTELLATIDGLTPDARQALPDIITEAIGIGLKRDGVVKIKGIGTFKVVDVKARKSVNINSGEEIQIPAHRKVTFTAEAKLADAVNQPLAHLETIELGQPAEPETPQPTPPVDTEENAGLQKLSNDADELMNILSAINNVPEEAVGNNEEKQEQEETPTEEPEPTETIIPEETPTPQHSETATKAATEETQPEEKPTEKPAAEPEPSATPEPAEKPEQQQSRTTDAYQDYLEAKRHNRKRKATTISLIVIFVLMLAGGGVSLYMHLSRKAGEKQQLLQQTVHTDNVIATHPEPQPASSSEPETAEPVRPEAPKPEPPKPAEQTFDQIKNAPRTYNETLRTEIVAEGNRLTVMALNAYGHKAFWVFIYEANRDQIADPNKVRTGMKIRIPRMDPRLVDPNDPRCIAYANELQQLYIK